MFISKVLTRLHNRALQQTNYQLPRYVSDRVKPKKSGRNMMRIGFVGLTTGALIGTGYSVYYMNQPRGHIVNEQVTIPIVKDIPKITPSRSVKILGDESGLKLLLFQYQTCPFCCKVRAFLDYYGISYDIIEVDPVLKQSIKWSPYKKVPILVAITEDGYQPMNDSTMIISTLASYLRDSQRNIEDIVSCFPIVDYFDESGNKKSEIMNRYFLMLGNEKFQKVNADKYNEERKWRKWADDVLVHVLSPNVYRTRDEALQSFNWFSEVGEWEKNFPTWERNLIIYVGASAMYLIGKRLKKKYNLKDDVRQSLYDESNKWMKSLGAKGTTFMGGQSPNLADLAVFGILSSIEGCEAFKDLLEHTNIGKWYFPMKEAVVRHRGLELV